MKIYVDFYGIVKGEDQKIGTLVWDGNNFSWKLVKEESLKTVLDDPINIMDEIIEAKKEPEKYMRNLFMAYTGTYFRASKPRIKKGDR